MIRIDILVPVFVDLWDEKVLEAAKKVAAPDVDIHICHLEHGVASLESGYDVAVSGKCVVDKAQELEAQGSQGIVVYCFKDPVIDACKEKLNIPVVGIREAAIALAGLMGDNIAVITTRKFSVAQYKRVLKGKVHEVTCLDIPVLELGDYERVYKTLDERVGQVAAKGSDIVVLGCGSILNLDFHSIEEKYGIPIVLPVYAGVIACEFMVRTGLKQSRIAYPIPDEKEFR